MIPQLLATAASMGGSLFQYIGQQETNRSNENMSNQANQMNQANAREQMAFQERMSNSAMTRAKQDAINAGFNPLLGMDQGASSPAGASGSASAATMENPVPDMSSLVTSAMEAKRLKMAEEKQAQEISNLKANEELSHAQKKNTQMNTAKTQLDATLQSTQLPQKELQKDIWNKVRDATRNTSRDSKTLWESLDDFNMFERSGARNLPVKPNPNKKIKRPNYDDYQP